MNVVDSSRDNDFVIFCKTFISSFLQIETGSPLYFWQYIDFLCFVIYYYILHLMTSDSLIDWFPILQRVLSSLYIYGVTHDTS